MSCMFHSEIHAVTRNMLNLQRIASSQMCIIQVRSNSSGTSQSKVYPKSTSHYDTLEIKTDATQKEIKSAYYKLTMQYHPDKNKLESAKQKFQDISDAYEVLGNLESRKHYDKTLKIQQKQSTFYNVKPTSRSTRTNMYPQDIKIYDFDEWTRQHYGHIFERHKKRKSRQRVYEPMNDEEQRMRVFSVTFMYFVCVFSSVMILLILRERRVNENRGELRKFIKD